MATGYCVDTSTGKRIWPRDEDLPVRKFYAQIKQANTNQSIKQTQIHKNTIKQTVTAKATHTKVAVPVSKSKEKVEMPSKKKVSVPVSKAKSKVAVPMSKTAVVNDYY